MRNTIHRNLLCAVMALFTSVALADADLQGAKDHPLVSRFNGAVIKDYVVSLYDEKRLIVKPLHNSKSAVDAVVSVAGTVTYINYQLPATVSQLELVQSYEEALAAKGFAVVFKCWQRSECGGGLDDVVVNQTMKRGKGSKKVYFDQDNRYLLAKKTSEQGDVYVMVYAMADNHGAAADVLVLQAKPMPKDQVQVSDNIALDSNGHVAVTTPDMAGAQDNPLVSRFKGAAIRGYLVSEFEEKQMPNKAISSRPTPDELLTIAGKVTYINYELPGTVSQFEAVRSYEDALTAKGFEVVFSCWQRKDCGSNMDNFVAGGTVMKRGKGRSKIYYNQDNRYLLARKATAAGDVVVMALAMANNDGAALDLLVIEPKPMQADQVKVADAAKLKQGIEAEGKVAVYGIYFDTDKAELKPESSAALEQMAKLLKDNPTLNVYIVGHTDNQGTLAHNKALSMQRAHAVVDALSNRFHIDAKRLSADGLASLSPVGSNRNESGRALNRRVELVEQ